MNIAIRVDASSQIGTGHFMRCLTLADALKQRGAKIRFVSRLLPEHLQDMLNEKGHEFALLDRSDDERIIDGTAHAHWLGVSQSRDAQDSIQALKDQTWDWLVVDHYALDFRWESMLRKAARKILVIDDIADRQHDCDMLLDQNYYTDMQTRYTGKVPEHCRLLLGPCYALLREEFRKLRAQIKPRTGEVKRIFVFFGGVDAGNYTGLAIEALSGLDLEGGEVDVVIGAQHPRRTEIERACASQGYACHVQTNRMAELMTAADLAIGAGGTAIWERCCLGLPTLVMCTADNQHQQAAHAARAVLLCFPEVKDKPAYAIQRHLRALMENGSLRHAISRNGMQAVDGRGVLRVIGQLGCEVEVRLAREDDARKVFEWRNHPSIRGVSRKQNVIKWNDHQNWFVSALTDPRKVLLIGEIGEIPIGVVRFDIKDDEAEVSIYLVPGSRQPVQGRDLLQSAERWLAANRADVRRIRAHVLGCNERSQRLFVGSGYQVESTSYLKVLC